MRELQLFVNLVNVPQWSQGFITLDITRAWSSPQSQGTLSGATTHAVHSTVQYSTYSTVQSSLTLSLTIIGYMRIWDGVSLIPGKKYWLSLSLLYVKLLIVLGNIRTKIRYSLKTLYIYHFWISYCKLKIICWKIEKKNIKFCLVYWFKNQR